MELKRGGLQVSLDLIKNLDYQSAEECLKKVIIPKLSYEKNCLQLISNYKKPVLLQIYNKINEIKEALQITKNNSNFFCSKIAHYTSCNTALKLLKDSHEHDYSPFRLSTIEFMNDPTEGKILHEWLQIHQNNEKRKYYAFASCFSFNYDSLNQFRLYGKKDNIETTGVSLVFNLNLFSNEKNNDHILHPNLTITLEDETNGIEEKELKYPLYRCLYFDPQNGYFKVAKRSEYSFYKEYAGLPIKVLKTIISQYQLQSITRPADCFNKNIYNDQNEQIDQNSKSTLIGNIYKYYLHSIEDGERHLNNLFQELEALTNEIDKSDLELSLTLNELFLPLRYLIKDPAFEEEQECRIITIVPLNNEKIITQNDKSFFYINYDVPLKEYIDEIYLGEGAKSYQIFFEKVLSNSEKVKISENPFRINRNL